LVQTYDYGPPMLISAMTVAVIQCIIEGADLVIWCLISITGREIWIGLFPFRCVYMTNLIELNLLYTTQLTVVNLQLVTSATCFGLVWPSSGLQKLVSIKVYNVTVPMGSHGNHGIPSVQQHYVPLLILTFVSLMMAKQGRSHGSHGIPSVQQHYVPWY